MPFVTSEGADPPPHTHFPPFPPPPAGPAPLFSKCAPTTLHRPAHQYPSALVPAPACLWKKLQRLFSGATQRGAECGKSAALHRTTLTQSHTVTHRRCGFAAGGGSTARDSGTSWCQAEEPLGRSTTEEPRGSCAEVREKLASPPLEVSSGSPANFVRPPRECLDEREVLGGSRRIGAHAPPRPKHRSTFPLCFFFFFFAGLCSEVKVLLNRR